MATPSKEVGRIEERLAEIQTRRAIRSKEIAPEMIASMAKVGAFTAESEEVALLVDQWVKEVERIKGV